MIRVPVTPLQADAFVIYVLERAACCWDDTDPEQADLFVVADRTELRARELLVPRELVSVTFRVLCEAANSAGEGSIWQAWPAAERALRKLADKVVAR